MYRELAPPPDLAESVACVWTSVSRGGVLDKVMIVSVGLAVVAFGVWFFAFAGSSLPT